MARLEELQKDATVRGILPDRLVTVVDVRWHGGNVVEPTYKDAAGQFACELLIREREQALEVVTAGRPWSFDRAPGSGGAGDLNNQRTLV